MASSARAHVMGAKAAPGAPVRRGPPGGSGGNAPPRPLDRQLKKSRGGGTELTAQRVREVTVPAPCRGVEFGKGNDGNDNGVWARAGFMLTAGVRAGGGAVAATARRWREGEGKGGWRRKSSGGRVGW
jgi:hypothetical protein